MDRTTGRPLIPVFSIFGVATHFDDLVEYIVYRDVDFGWHRISIQKQELIFWTDTKQHGKGGTMAGVGFVGWRGMVGSVLMDRMKSENDFTGFEPHFFSTTQAGNKGPDIGDRPTNGFRRKQSR
jgi:hypothetical protein